MNRLNLSGNLIQLRKKRGVTQEELAGFLGVTKASVSKWENNLSMPDVQTLPRLASYFDVSIDELMGYQAQLSNKEIQKYYRQFSEAFAKEPFQQVRERVQEFVKEYYSCYPAILQAAILYLNHYMLLPDVREQKKILEEMKTICIHIEEHCLDRDICEDAMVVRSMCCLASAEAEEVIRNLAGFHNPRRLREQSDGLLVQAYQMTGQTNLADECNQYMVFKHLIQLISDSFALVMFHMQEKERGMQTIERLRQIIEIYDIKHLHPNTYLQYEFLCAQFYCLHGMKKEALEELKKYARGCVQIVQYGVLMKGDSYFDRLEAYFQSCEIVTAPRDNKIIIDTAATALEHPIFEPIKNTEEFQKVREIFARQE